MTEFKLKLESKDEVKMLVEILEAEIEGLEDRLNNTNHYTKAELKLYRWDFEHTKRLLKELNSFKER